MEIDTNLLTGKGKFRVYEGKFLYPPLKNIMNAIQHTRGAKCLLKISVNVMLWRECEQAEIKRRLKISTLATERVHCIFSHFWMSFIYFFIFNFVCSLTSHWIHIGTRSVEKYSETFLRWFALKTFNIDKLFKQWVSKK